MYPPVEIRDRSEYKARMNALLTLDPQRTVVVTVDMQREYLDTAIGGDPLAQDEADRVLRNAKELLDFARTERLPVIHAYVSREPAEVERRFDARPLGTVTREANLSQNAQAGVRKIPDRLRGSPQAEIPALLLDPGDVHVPTKKTLDSWQYTNLEMFVRRVFQANAVVLAGINTDTCVYCAAFGASNRGFKPVVISDCVASNRGKDHHWMALDLMSRSFAWVLTLAEFKQKIRPQ